MLCQLQRSLDSPLEGLNDSSRDLSPNGLTRIGAAIPFEADTVLAKARDDVKLPVCDQVIALAGEIILGDVGDTVGVCRVDDGPADQLRRPDRRDEHVGRQIDEPLSMDARHNNHVIPIDGSAAHKGLYQRIGIHCDRGIVESAERAGRGLVSHRRDACGYLTP